MREIEEYKTTTNRYVYNRLRKMNLEQTAEIHCSYCGYHKHENSTNKYYEGSYGGKIKYPNWKLVSKNKKQWMMKKLKRKQIWFKDPDYFKFVIAGVV